MGKPAIRQIGPKAERDGGSETRLSPGSRRQIASEVGWAGEECGGRGYGGATLAELRLVGVVGAKFRAEVLAGRGAPKFNVAVAGAERRAAEHAAARAAVDEIPAAGEHRNLSPGTTRSLDRGSPVVKA